MPAVDALKRFGGVVSEKFHALLGEFGDVTDAPPPAYRTDNSCYEKPSTPSYPKGAPYVAPEKQRPFRLGSVYVG